MFFLNSPLLRRIKRRSAIKMAAVTGRCSELGILISDRPTPYGTRRTFSTGFGEYLYTIYL